MHFFQYVACDQERDMDTQSFDGVDIQQKEKFRFLGFQLDSLPILSLSVTS